MEIHNAKLVLCRHAASEWSEQKRFTGHTDIPLSTKGHQQATAVAKAIAALSPCAVISSDLQRASQTAQYIAKAASVSLKLDPQLREEDVGDWAGKTREEVAQLFPGTLERPINGGFEPHDTREGLLSTGQRAIRFIFSALACHAQSPDKPLVVVSHVNTILAVIGILLNLPPSRWRLLKGLSPAAYSLLEINQNCWQLNQHNIQVF